MQPLLSGLRAVTQSRLRLKPQALFASQTGWCGMFRNAIRRASSAPAAQKEATPLGHSIDVAAREEDLGHSVGTSDARSPKHYSALCKIRSKLMNAQMHMQPHVQFSLWESYVYVACWWRPLFHPNGVMDPSKWHTSVLRAYLSPGVDVAPWMPGWNLLAQGTRLRISKRYSNVALKLGLVGSGKVW